MSADDMFHILTDTIRVIGDTYIHIGLAVFLKTADSPKDCPEDMSVSTYAAYLFFISPAFPEDYCLTAKFVD